MAADRLAHRLDRRRHHLPRRLAAGRELRRIPLRHSELTVVFEPDEHTACTSTRGPATGCCSSHWPTWPAGSKSSHPARWQREPIARHPGRNQHRGRRRRRHRRRVLPGLQRVRRAVAADARHRAPGNWTRSSPLPPSSTPKTSPWHSISSHRRTAPRSRTFVVRPNGVGDPRARPDAAGRLRRIRVVQHTGLQRRAGAAVAGPRGHLRAGQHPRRRRVRAGLAHPGDARGPAQGRRGFRRGGRPIW